jgi:hypothetical protein
MTRRSGRSTAIARERASVQVLAHGSARARRSSRTPPLGHAARSQKSRIASGV